MHLNVLFSDGGLSLNVSGLSNFFVPSFKLLSILCLFLMCSSSKLILCIHRVHNSIILKIGGQRRPGGQYEQNWGTGAVHFY